MARVGSTSAPIFGITVTIAALFQMFVYSSVVLYSLFWGGVDLVVPVKMAYIAIVSMGMVKALETLIIGWNAKSFDMSRFTEAVILFALTIIGSTSFFVLASPFLFRPLSSIDLTAQAFEVKGLTSVGVLLLLGFIGAQTWGLIRIKFSRRTGPTPKGPTPAERG